MLKLRSPMFALLSTLAIGALCAPLAQAQFGKILEGITKNGGPSSDKTASGLKEALQIGTDHAVDFTGTTDGFFKNEAIKILLPDKLKTAERGLRAVGMGSKLDEFELSMNRAAEQSTPAARSIFKDAVMQMTFDDVRKIMTGGDTAATDYFKSKTSEKLAAAFKPTVSSAMENTGVVKQYNQLTGGMQSLPFARSQSFDITDYVVGKALDGLFLIVGQEEKKICTDPASQVTPLLKEVFGKH
jgi:Protein of unknown function (DUF4197)